MKQNRNIVRLTESQLKAMVAEELKKALNEIGDTNRGQYMLGRLAGRKFMRGDSKEEVGDVVKHAKNNNMNNHMGDDYFAYGLADYASYFDPDHENVERLTAKSMVRNMPKNAKEAVGGINAVGSKDFPEHAYGPFGNIYDKNGNRVKFVPENRNELSRLSESKLYKIVSESVKRVLRESVNKFEFGEPRNVGRTGKVGDSDRRLIRRQDIWLGRYKVGRLITFEGSPEEVYYIVDADYRPQYTNYIDERPERIWEVPDFKKFTNYDEALKYAIDNLDKIQGVMGIR